MSAFWLVLSLERSSATGVSIRFVMVRAQHFLRITAVSCCDGQAVLFHRYFSSDVSPNRNWQSYFGLGAGVRLLKIGELLRQIIQQDLMLLKGQLTALPDCDFSFIVR